MCTTMDMYSHCIAEHEFRVTDFLATEIRETAVSALKARIMARKKSNLWRRRRKTAQQQQPRARAPQEEQERRRQTEQCAQQQRRLEESQEETATRRCSSALSHPRWMKDFCAVVPTGSFWEYFFTGKLPFTTTMRKAATITRYILLPLVFADAIFPDKMAATVSCSAQREQGGK